VLLDSVHAGLTEDEQFLELLSATKLPPFCKKMANRRVNPPMILSVSLGPKSRHDDSAKDEKDSQ
jgi:hypothetical protein